MWLWTVILSAECPLVSVSWYYGTNQQLSSNGMRLQVADSPWSLNHSVFRFKLLPCYYNYLGQMYHFSILSLVYLFFHFTVNCSRSFCCILKMFTYDECVGVNVWTELADLPEPSEERGTEAEWDQWVAAVAGQQWGSWAGTSGDRHGTRIWGIWNGSIWNNTQGG